MKLISKEDIPNGASPLYAPYYGHQFEACGQQFWITIAEGYNAGGLIGTECNGIALISKKLKAIVFTEHMRIGMGRDGEVKQKAEVDRILAMTDEQFAAWLPTVGKLHINPLEKKEKIPRKLNKKLLNEWLTLHNSNELSYNSENKRIYLRTGGLILKALAEVISARLKPGDAAGHRFRYAITTNPGGIAVSGDVYLSTSLFKVLLEPGVSDDHYFTGVYVSLGQCHTTKNFMARTCSGVGATVSGPNTWFKPEELLDLPKLADNLMRMRRDRYVIEAIDVEMAELATA